MLNVKKISANPFIKGGILLTLSSNLVNVLNYLFNLFAARALGPEGLGELAAFMSYIVIVSAPAMVISTVIIQKIGAADNKMAFAAALEHWYHHKIRKWFVFIILILCIAPFIPRLTNLSYYSGLLVIPFILLTLYVGFSDATLQGLRLFSMFSLIAVLTTLIKFSGALASFSFGGGTIVILLFILASLIFKISVNQFYLYKVTREVKVSTKKIEKRILDIIKQREIIFTAATIIAVTLFNNIDIIYAKKFLSGYDAGIYSSWSLLAKIIFYFAGPLFSISLIFFSSKDQKEKHISTFTATMIGIILFAVASFIGYSFLGNIIVPLFFGNKFNAVIPVLGKASIFGSLYLAMTFINQYFLARKIMYSLLVVLIIPIYIGALFIIRPSLYALIDLNNVILGVTVGLYCIAALKEQYFDKKPVTF